jgi:hypothetical protein
MTTTLHDRGRRAAGSAPTIDKMVKPFADVGMSTQEPQDALIRPTEPVLWMRRWLCIHGGFVWSGRQTSRRRTWASGPRCAVRGSGGSRVYGGARHRSRWSSETLKVTHASGGAAPGLEGGGGRLRAPSRTVVVRSGVPGFGIDPMRSPLTGGTVHGRSPADDRHAGSTAF